MSKIKSVEMIRSVAALLVILFHIKTTFRVPISLEPLDILFDGGFRGVDLFFVLSGFIIYIAHRNDIAQPSRVWSYIFKRLARIYPAVWIMSLFAALFYCFDLGDPSKAEKLNPLNIICSFLLLPQRQVPLVNVSWTLVYEMFFYAVFAMMILNRKLGISFMLVWQASVAFLAMTGAYPGIAKYYLAPICLDFGWGVLCGIWVCRTNHQRIWPVGYIILAAIGITCFVSGIVLNDRSGWDDVLCGLGSGFVIVALVLLEKKGHIQVHEMFLILGAGSYSIYLIHFSVIQILSTFIRRFYGPENSMFYLWYALAGILSGLAFHRWVDAPIQRKLRRL